MKKNILLLSLVLWSICVFSQTPDANQLIQIHEVTNVEMNAITSPIEGSIVYNTEEKRIYQYDGGNWLEIVVTTPTIKALTSSYTLTALDNGKVLTINSVGTTTLTIPSGLPIGFNISLYQIGNGKITIVGSGTTVKNRLQRFTTAGLDAGVGIVCTAVNVFYVTGDLKK